MKPFERPFSFTKKKEFVFLDDITKANIRFLPSLPSLPLWLQPKYYLCSQENYPLQNPHIPKQER